MSESETNQKTPSCCAPASGRVGAAAVDKPTSKDTAGVSPTAGADSTVGPPMVPLAGGRFLMGTDYAKGFPADGEGPVRPVTLTPYRIDRTPVTNEAFAAFVEATHYVTEAERFGWSFVFWAHIPKRRFAELVQDTVNSAPWWCKVAKACWRQPEGPGSHVDRRPTHPVVHVSWNDATAYAQWAGRELPTEAQWECAARGGLEQKLYPWGDTLRPGGEHRCNIWQGRFPTADTGEDGYAGACPVESFPPNGFGLYSTTGNVWEWCADWFGTSFVADELHDPPGPASGHAKVIKGGSFLCHASYCNRYRVAARTSNTPDSSASNIGFRCAAPVAPSQ